MRRKNTHRARLTVISARSSGLAPRSLKLSVSGHGTRNTHHSAPGPRWGRGSGARTHEPPDPHFLPRWASEWWQGLPLLPQANRRDRLPAPSSRSSPQATHLCFQAGRLSRRDTVPHSLGYEVARFLRPLDHLQPRARFLAWQSHGNNRTVGIKRGR